MLISNLIQEDINNEILSLWECEYELTIATLKFNNGLLNADNKLMETQMIAFSNMMATGELY